MIIASITSFDGQCADAEHYYCNYTKTEETEIKSDFYAYHNRTDNTELTRKITSAKECLHLNKKEGRGSWKIGRDTEKFNSYSQIHKLLIEMFPEETIITYKERDIFKDMLYYKDGKNLGYKAFGEVFSSCPSSCYTDLLPPIDEIKIICECGHEYKLEDVTTEQDWEGRKLTTFKRKKKMDKLCCRDFYLEWNVIL